MQPTSSKPERSKSSVRYESRRESSSVPYKLSSFMEGKHLSVVPKDEPEILDPLNPPYSRWIYHTVLILLMGVVVILSISSIYIELLAYLADVEWNGILQDKIVFPSSKDKIFGGKKLSQVHSFFPSSANKHPINMKHDLTRGQNLETSFLCMVFFSLISTTVGLILFIVKGAKNDWRKLLIGASMGFGFLGVLMCLGSILLLSSTLIHIPSGFIHLRTMLEDGLVDKHKDVEHREWPKITDNCAVNTSFKHAVELQRLLDVTKICVYSRYVTMNLRDPCREKRLVTSVSVDKKSYNLEDLEALHICPMDDKKMLAMYIVLIAALISWIISWVSSYASKVFFPYAHIHIHSSLLYQPAAVSDLPDLTTGEPSEMHIGLASPSELLIVPPAGPTPIMDVDSGGAGASILTTVANAGGTRSSYQRKKSTDRELVSIMDIAPHMVIHPPSDNTTRARWKFAITNIAAASDSDETTPPTTDNEMKPIPEPQQQQRPEKQEKQRKKSDSPASSWFKDD